MSNPSVTTQCYYTNNPTLHFSLITTSQGSVLNLHDLRDLIFHFKPSALTRPP